MIGPWYDPIEHRWHTPRVVVPEPPTSAYKSEEDLGRQMASAQAIWDAVTATAQATQQERAP